MKRIGSLGRWATAPAALGFLGLVGTAVPALAQQIRYVGEAVRTIQPDGTRQEDARAGAMGEPDPCAATGAPISILCDASDPSCFDVACGSSTTKGGAFDAEGAPRPGFGRVESAASGSASTIAGLVEIVSGATTATADAETGALETTCSCAAVSIAGTPLDECPEGEGLPVPFNLLGVSGTVFPCKRTVTVEDGLAVVRIAGAVIEEEGGGTTTLALSTAGIETPFTTGGAGGCSAAGPSGAGDEAAVAATLALLGWIARRRRRGSAGCAFR